MMRNMIGTAAAIGLALACGTAHAESFQGPYVGVQAGWNRDSIGSANSDVGRLDMHESRDAFFGGGFAGYDHQLTDKIVVGVEAGFDIAADDASRVGGSLIDPNYSFDIGARAGYVVGGNTLLYVRGSYENMRARIALSDTSGTLSGHDSFDGWGVGAGVERFVADKVTARIEYRYSDLGNGGKFDRHQTLVGLAYHF
ncbi:porin family protein [Sphingobium yanoikuyae]|uniref:Porin family protein n=1 Tax=Sphingobium yanoikuyae TaxID=13690 RepID=A0A6M4GB29_SPHYA|nr:porin family protein [Sphingobium yanoikuyae]QJR04170.1 porin family protein [Sphingobium yanoikuyae]